MHVDTKHLAGSGITAIHHCHVDRSLVSLWQGQRNTDIRVKGQRLIIARWASDCRPELSLEEILNEGVVPLHVTVQILSSHHLIRTTSTVL